MQFLQNMKAVIVGLVILFPVLLMAETPQEMAVNKKVIADKLLKINPQYKIIDFKPAGMEGFYSVQLDQGPKLYFAKSGDFFFDGDLYSIKNGTMVNLTDKETAANRLVLMKEFNPKEMIVFSPKPPVKTKGYMTVFTDIDCGYCVKLHQEVPELNAHGIEVRYLGFPRAGIGSESHKKLVSAWCSPNKQDALTKLKNRETIPQKTCDDPVAKQYDLGKRMGVTGTPAIILKDGTLIPGYRPAADLIKIIGI
jgi:thiol:disulfide interchange protein DsbC